MKNRKQKAIEYEEKYNDIPKNYYERLLWLTNKLNISENKYDSILEKRNAMINSLSCTELIIVLYEEPEGAKRHRYRLVNRKNLVESATKNPNFIHVYSPSANEDNCYMKRLIDEELYSIQGLLDTPCYVEFNAFLKTPEVYNTTDIMLSEIGIIRPPTKPDWDNLGKKYSDMFNGNVWLDDNLVIDGTVRKFYSTLPRIEINLKWLNMLYNKYQYKTIVNRTTNKSLTYFGGNNNGTRT